MTLVRRAFGIERRGATGPWGDSTPPPPGGQSGILAPGDPMRISTFLSCCLAVSEDVAMLPLGAYQDRDGASAPIPTPPPIVADPFLKSSSRISAQIGIGQIVMSLLLRGNGYCQIVERGAGGLPTGLVVMNPDAVQPRVDTYGSVEYRVNGVVVDSSKLVHILGPSLPGSCVGLSVVEFQRMLLGLTGSVDRYMASWMTSGAAPAGVLKVARPLSKTQADGVKEAWNAAHAGVGRAGGVAVLGGGAEYQPLTVKPEDAQWLETRGMLREDICGLFGVPPQRVGVVSGKGGGGAASGKAAETAHLQYLTQTLMRWTSRIESAWTDMLPGAGTLARFNWSVLTRPDSATRWSNYLIGRTVGAITNGEIRADEGLAPLDDPLMDDPMAPLNSAHTLQGSAGPGDGADNPQANGLAGPVTLARALAELYPGEGN